MEQTAIDNKMKELDGTDNKAKLGANAILAVSLAVAKVCAPFCAPLPLQRRSEYAILYFQQYASRKKCISWALLPLVWEM